MLARPALFLGICASMLALGCASSDPFTTRANRNKLDLIELGMSKAEVREILGRPYKREVYMDAKGQPIDILLYQTHFVGMAVTPQDADLTPLVFVNGALAGWGRNFYDQSVHIDLKQSIRIED